MKIEKRITEDDLNELIKEKGLCDETYYMLSALQLQTLKDQQAKEVEFEIVQPKQLT